MLREEVDEGADARGRAGPADEERVDLLDIAGVELLEDRDQLTARDLGRDAEGPDASDPEPQRRELPERLAIVRLDALCEREREVATILAEGPRGLLPANAEVEAPVVVELPGHRRRPVAREVLRRRHDDPPRLTELPGR